MADMNLSPEAQAQLAKLATDLANNPKTRKKFVGLVKEIDPTKRFPDVETDEIREEMKKEFEKRDQEREAARAKERLENQRAQVASRYDEKAMGEIEKLMEKLGVSDYEVGARIYAAETKPADPTYPEDDHRWTLPKIDIKDFGNLDQIARSNAYKAIDDIKRQRKAS